MIPAASRGAGQRAQALLADWPAFGMALKMAARHEGVAGAPNTQAMLELLGEHVPPVLESHAALCEALLALALHAQETYPHFESERGQADIARALDALRSAGAVGEGGGL